MQSTTSFSWAVTLGLSMLLAAQAKAYAPGPEKEAESLERFGIHLEHEGQRFKGSHVYRQIIDRSQNVIQHQNVTHGLYLDGKYEMRSQQPHHATVSGVPFFEYIERNYNTGPGDPLFSKDSEIALCMLNDSTILYEVEKEAIKKYFDQHDGSIAYYNHCVDNELMRDYWENRYDNVDVR